MDTKLIVSSSVAVFLAELGDKTQLAVLSMSSTTRDRVPLFIGATLGLMAATGMAILAGDLVNRVLSPVWIKRISGAMFIAIGLWILFGKKDS